MLLEVERQKCNRSLEKAQKALSDTRWKKKKETQAQDAESGLSFPVSEIADARIKHTDSASVKSSLDVYKTNYNELTDVHVVDVNERPPEIITLPLPLQLDFFQAAGSLERKVEFDRYSRKHYQKMVDHSLQSWERLQHSTLACDVKSQQLAQNSVSESLNNSMTSSLGSPGERSSFRGGGGRGGSTVLTAGGGGGNSTVSSRVGRTLATRLTNQSNTFSNNNSANSNISAVGSSHKQQLLRSMHTLLTFKKQSQSLQESSLASSSISSLDEQQHDQMMSKASTGRKTSSKSTSKQTAGKKKKNARLSPLTLPIPSSPSSLMSMSSKGPLSLSLALHHLPLAQFEQDLLSTHEEKLENDGIYIPLPSSGYDNNSSYGSFHAAAVKEKKRLDGVFYSSSAQSGWGRGYGHTVGVMRSLPLPSANIDNKGSTHHHHLSKKEKEEMKKQQADEASRKANGLGKKHLVDVRLLPRLQSEVLTVKHHGMDAFSGSMSLHSSSGGH